ncbi:hypothetical protein N7527_004658 [Penicillium freii]|nr:hypothetical protein N7527_004658 [Penicillium freii]
MGPTRPRRSQIALVFSVECWSRFGDAGSCAVEKGLAALLRWAITSNKVTKRSLDPSVRRVLGTVKKAHAEAPLNVPTASSNSGDTDAIVLLKNDKGVLPLDPVRDYTYALIGPGVHHPAVSGGGSADLTPYHGVSRTPLLATCVTIPATSLPRYIVEWYITDPIESPSIEPVASTTTTEASICFADNLPENDPAKYWLLARTNYTVV